MMKRRPNIVLVTSHDLGRHLGCYGRRSVPSAAINAWASDAVLFTGSFCTAPQCSPSRASLHTGRYPHATGVHGLTHGNFGWALHPNEEHFANRLRKEGYETALAGVQHLTNNASELGYNTVLPVQRAVDLAKQAAEWIATASANNKPFYLEVGFFEPHRPYEWGDSKPYDGLGIEVPNYLPDVPDTRKDTAALQGAIKQLDDGMGILLDSIRSTGCEDRTWVIFTTDHGIAMPRAKATLYDPGIETALIMRWPEAGIRGGISNPHLISHVDIVPTMLEAMDMMIPPQVQGASFWKLLKGDTTYTPRSYIFAEKTFHAYYEPMRAVRTDRYKFIANFECGPKFDIPADIRKSPSYQAMLRDVASERLHFELYDLVEDPTETINVYGHPAYGDVINPLRTVLKDWMTETADPLLSGSVASPFYYRTLQWLNEGGK
jgi:N-sulfoglucosamine sulfohydrolase